jgi:hypothetical protein
MCSHALLWQLGFTGKVCPWGTEYSSCRCCVTRWQRYKINDLEATTTFCPKKAPNERHNQRTQSTNGLPSSRMCIHDCVRGGGHSVGNWPEDNSGPLIGSAPYTATHTSMQKPGIRSLASEAFCCPAMPSPARKGSRAHQLQH